MPHTNKSLDLLAADSSGSVKSRASAEEESPSWEENKASGEQGDGEDNVGDSEIIKSPSDPKNYR